MVQNSAAAIPKPTRSATRRGTSFAKRAEKSIAEALKSLARPIRNNATGALTIAMRTGRLAGTAGMPIALWMAFCQSVSRTSP